MSERLDRDKKAEVEGKFLAPAPRVGRPKIDGENRNTYNHAPVLDQTQVLQRRKSPSLSVYKPFLKQESFDCSEVIMDYFKIGVEYSGDCSEVRMDFNIGVEYSGIALCFPENGGQELSGVKGDPNKLDVVCPVYRKPVLPDGGAWVAYSGVLYQ